MNRFRRTALAATGFLAAALTALTAAPAAFAMRLAPPDGGSSSAAASGAGSGGITTWEAVVICVGVALFVAVATTLVTRVRSRSILRPAVH